MKNLTWQNPEQLFVAQELINKVKSKCCGIKDHQNLSDFFHLKSNSSVNKDLKKIGVLAKIEKHFSFHTARHTNATLLIYNGAQITTVQKLLGHQSVKTTQGYSDIFSGTIVKDLKKCKF